MDFTLLGIVILVKFLQSSKALTPIEVIEFGKIIVAKSLQ